LKAASPFSERKRNSTLAGRLLVNQHRRMLARIVVPLDGSRLAATAVGPARSLAEVTGASLLLMTTHWDDDVGGAEEYLAGQAARLDVGHLETAIIHDRTAPDAILLEAHDPDTVICMSTHGRSGIGRAALGSIAETVLRDAHHPLLLVGPGLERGAWELAHWPTNGQLLVPVDGSKNSEAIVPTASEWARMLGLRASVAHVVPTSVGLVVERRDRPLQAAVLRRVADALPDASGVAGWEILHGTDVADSLVGYARERSVTLIAMATHGRTGFARFALGSIATRVVHKSPCPVLVLRSPDLA
jgi:nucleotide-binding universal stress UspA family protein